MSDSVSEPGVSDSVAMFGRQGPPPHISLRHKLRRKLPRVEDFILDVAMRRRIAAIKRHPAYLAMPRMRILAVGVQSPRRPGALDDIFARMASARHDIVFDQKEVEGKGKLENINILLARYDLSTFDWIWLVDDDVALPRDYTDIFTALAEMAELKICGPAQRAKSHASYFMTRRRYDSLVRETSFVEVGPITAFRREAFAEVFPLPNLRYGWGLDLTWPMLARRRGWRIGIVDAVPIEHLNPVAATYDSSAAVAEARAYMEEKGFISREEAWKTLRTWWRFPLDDGKPHKG
jgi:hypothetical protein